MLLLLLEPQSARPDGLKLQTALTDHHRNHHEADLFRQPYHPDSAGPQLGLFHGGVYTAEPDVAGQQSPARASCDFRAGGFACPNANRKRLSLLHRSEG